MLLLSLLLFFLFLLKHHNKSRKSGASDPEAEPRELQNSSSFATDVQEQNRCNFGGDASVIDFQPEKDKEMNSQDAPSEDPQNVTYARLSHLTLKRKTSAPSSSPIEEPPDEPSVYAALAIH
ncbi:leukocyte immunoglobulin-like receptor subfamily B member 2 [Molossus nigricans]